MTRYQFWLPKMSVLGRTILLTLAMSITVPAYAGKIWFAPEDEPLPAEEQKRIRDLVNESTAASAKSDWDAARAALMKAWEIKPLPMIAANLGYVEVNLGRYREAAEHLKFYIDNAPEGHPERRTDAEQRLSECHKHIAVISVTANVDGARVVMDGSEVGLTPLEKQFFVEPGMHSVRVTRLGYQPELRTVSVDADKDVMLQVVLRAEPALSNQPTPAVQLTSAQPAVGERSGIRARTWALIGGSAATTVSLGIGIAYRIHASSLSSDGDSTLAEIDHLPDTTQSQIAANAVCLNRTGTAQTLCEQLWSTRKSQDSATNISTAAFVTAGVFGLATIATYFLWPEGKSSTRHTTSRLKLAPMSLGKIQGVQIYTTF